MGTPPWRVQALHRNSTPHAERNRPQRDTSVAEMAAPAPPTEPGRYALPFFHRPHKVAAKARATLRRASFGDRPCSLHLLYRSAKGFFSEATADRAAPRMVPFSRRWLRRGTPKCSGPLPL